MQRIFGKVRPLIAAALAVVIALAAPPAATQRIYGAAPEAPVPYGDADGRGWSQLRELMFHLKSLNDHSLDDPQLSAERNNINTVLSGIPNFTRKIRSKDTEAEFLMGELREEMARLTIHTADDLTTADRIKPLWKDIKASAGYFKKLRRDRLNPVILLIAYQDIEDNFTALGEIPFDERLKALGIERAEYKKTAAEIMDEFAACFDVFARHEAKYLAGKPAAEKAGQKHCHNKDFEAVKNMLTDGGRRVVAAVNGSIKIKRAGEKEWRALEIGMNLASTDLLEAEGKAAAEITLRDTRLIRLDAGAVCTLWEIDFALTPGTMKKIDGIIAGLGDDDYEMRRAATGKLLEMDYLALPRLRKALPEADIETSARIRYLICKISGAADHGQRAGTSPVR